MDHTRRVVAAHYRKAVENPHEYLKYVIDETDYKKWYILMSNFSGNNDEYKSGQYLVRVELPNEYPYEPPHFYLMTPNGLYDTEKKACISIGEFHKKDYPATLGVVGFCEQLVSGFIGWKEIGHGISLIDTSEEEKKILAIKSASYNEKHNKKYMDMINESFGAYSKKWPV